MSDFNRISLSRYTELVGVQEIAILAGGVSSAAVANWRARFRDFPRPVAVLAGGPVFEADQVKSWLNKRAHSGGKVADVENSCFVIGPIGDELAPYGAPERVRYEQALEIWEKVIEPACMAAGVEPVRADKIARPGEITDQVFAQIRDADLIVADVTGGNPNVMYELGLRHTLHKATIQIGEHGQLPFDISAIRTLKFARTPAGLVDARKKLETAVRAAVAGDFDPVTATRLWNPMHPLEVSPQPVTDSSVDTAEDDQPGFLELLSEMESALPELNALSERARKSMERMGELATTATADVQRSDSMKAGFAGRLTVANKLAKDLSPIADELETIADGYEKRVTSVDSGMTCLLDIVEQDPSQAKEMEQFAQAVRLFVENVRRVSSQLSAFVATLSLPGKFSKSMRISVRRIAGSTDRVIKALSKSEVWNARLHRLVTSAT